MMNGKSISGFRRAAVAFVLFALAALSQAQQTNNYELRAVPAPGPVVIDGKCDDWDLSGEILICYDLQKLLDTHSVKAAAMYDSEYLYISMHFKDKTPMVNHVDPLKDPGAGWRSDAVQLRIKSDRIAHVDCWYFTDHKQPCMSIHYGAMAHDVKDPDTADLPDAMAAGAKQAFLADADGKGYVQEIAIPWKLIARDGHPMKAGDAMNMGIEVFWGDASGGTWPEHRYADLINAQRPQREFFWSTPDAWGKVLFLDHGKLPPSPSVAQLSDMERQAKLLYSTQGPVAVQYETPADGGVTLVVEKPDGTRVKNLISDYPRKAGKQTDYWDGTDDNGRLVEAGQYKVRGLCHGPLDVLYQFAYGNAGNPPYDNSTGTGNWMSNHENPFAVAADESRIYLAAAHAEGATSVLGVDYNGQRIWGHGNISAGLLARQGAYLYMLVGGYIFQPFVPEGEVHIVRVDPNSGKYVAFPDGKSSHKIASIPANMADWPVKPRPSEGQAVAGHLYDADWCQRQTLGFAASKDRLYASLYYQNKIIVIDPEKGEAVGEIAVEKPAGLATAGPSLFAISGKQVLYMETDANGIGKKEPYIERGLSAPIALAIDAAGNAYVSDWAEAMCVKVFSPDGERKGTIGKEGGRALSGAYDPSGMFRPFAIALDANDRLWVAEYDLSPRRISVWDTHGGRLLKEFCGSTWYASVGARVNQQDPNRAFVLGNTCELDWDKGLWRVTGTLFRPTKPEALFGLACEGMAMDVVRVKDRDLLVGSSTRLCCVAELHAADARPLAALGDVFALRDESGHIPDLAVAHLWDDANLLAWAKSKYPEAFSGIGPKARKSLADVLNTAQWPGSRQPRTQFLWTDKNGDGLVQEDEIQFYTKDELGGMVFQSRGWRFAYGPDLAMYLAGYSQQPDGRHLQLWRLPVKEWNKAGAPVYDVKDANRLMDEPVLSYVDSASWADSNGNTLMGETPMVMYSPAGKLLWTYPNPWPGVHGSHTAPKAKRGRIIGPLWTLGSAQMGGDIGEVFCLAGNLGERYFMTTDGLYVANVFEDCRSAPDVLPDQPRRGMSVNSSTAGGESFGGEFFLNPIDHRPYLGGPVGGCREASAITQVTGLDTVRRLPAQTLEFTVQQHTAAEALLAEQAAVGAAAKNLAIARMKAAVKDLPAQADWDWADRRVARWSFDARHTAEATWNYDDKNLYLCVRNVMDDTPMVNAGNDLRTLFKTGDAVEFELRTAAGKDDKQIIDGDLRLIISVFENKPVAVLYRYKAAGGATSQPVEFKSPVGVTRIDLVKVLDAAHIAIDRNATGYSVRAAVPLADLGFEPRKDGTYRGDFGIVYSDKAGKIDELRMYWANPVSAMVNDLSIEAQIVPAAWGRFQVEE